MQLELIDPYCPDVERVWRGLDEPSTRSFFLSWSWMENWLACLPRAHAPRLAVIREDQRPVAAFFLTRRNLMRLGVLGSRALFFNTTGVPRFDSLLLECNGVVGRDVSVGRLVDLLPDDWDELFLPGLRVGAFGGVADTVIRGFRVRVERAVPSYFVDLDRVRAHGYLALLGGQTRGQLRRAQREAGTLELDAAQDERTAFAIYDELVALHQQLWRARGQPGAWADPWFDRFHRRLISQRFRHGEIQLARLRCERGVLGALYNFVHRGRVYQYQSGFAMFPNRHLKPGYLAHAAAIEHAAALGHTVYDFLGGDRRYKKSLATGQSSLVWARVQRARFRFLVEDRLRAWARAHRAGGDTAHT